jgi:hypothetical protein
MKKSGDRYVVVPIGMIVFLLVAAVVLTMRSCGYRPPQDSASVSNGGQIKDYAAPAPEPTKPGGTSQQKQ